MSFATIVADPPWRYTVEKRPRASHPRGVAEYHYDTMTMEEIADLGPRVIDLAADDAHLYMWTTNVVLTQQRTGPLSAPAVCRMWGFEPKTIVTWLKPQLGMGFFFRGCTEHVIFATRGKAPIPAELREPNHFAAKRTEHSAKPDCFYDMVERVSPAPRVEMFARRARFGWEYWGDESLSTVEMAG